ncbi:hypothetical protein HDR59_00885 [bacterium]|nr:hypothetical protein [bacterium]
MLCFSLQGKAGIIAVPADEVETSSATEKTELTDEQKIEQLVKEIDYIYEILTDRHKLVVAKTQNATIYGEVNLNNKDSLIGFKPEFDSADSITFYNLTPEEKIQYIKDRIKSSQVYNQEINK